MANPKFAMPEPSSENFISPNTTRRKVEHNTGDSNQKDTSDGQISLGKESNSKKDSSNPAGSTSVLLKGAIRYSSNLPLMLFNQMKESKIIKGKKPKE